MMPTRYASFFKRLVAFLVDWLLSTLIAGALMIPLFIFLIPKWIWDTLVSRWIGHHWFNFNFDLENLCPDLLWFAIPWNIFLVFMGFFLIRWLYFALFESGPRQATPGKMIMGIFVTDLYGRRISFQRALGRTLAKIISKMCCYMGYILALFTERNQALHDFIAGTLVLEPDYIPARNIQSPPVQTYPDAPQINSSGAPGPETKA
jgi:uncharacterized RDD family membrane protein YckC